MKIKTKKIPNDPPARYKIGASIVRPVTFEHPDFGRVQVCAAEEGVYFVAENVAQRFGLHEVKQLERRLDPGDFKITSGEEGVSGLGAMLLSVTAIQDLVICTKSLESKEFESWVLEDVLPSLTGGNDLLVDGLHAHPIGEETRDVKQKRGRDRVRKRFLETRNQLAELVEAAEAEFEQAKIRLKNSKAQLRAYSSYSKGAARTYCAVDLDTLAELLDNAWQRQDVCRFLRELRLITKDYRISEESRYFFREIPVLQSVGPNGEPKWSTDILVYSFGISHVEQLYSMRFLYAERFGPQEGVEIAAPSTFAR